MLYRSGKLQQIELWRKILILTGARKECAERLPKSLMPEKPAMGKTLMRVAGIGIGKRIESRQEKKAAGTTYSPNGA
jgi:hypothetical protein